jgi:hypothetical protein
MDMEQLYVDDNVLQNIQSATNIQGTRTQINITVTAVETSNLNF